MHVCACAWCVLGVMTHQFVGTLTKLCVCVRVCVHVCVHL